MIALNPTVKRKHLEKSLKTKYEALIKLEEGEISNVVAEKFGVPVNMLSTWKKKHEYIREF